MKKMSQFLSSLMALAFIATACGTPSETDQLDEDRPVNTTATNTDDDFPLSDVAALKDGAPPKADLVEETKADEILPTKFDLISEQSPVKSQGSRGVCSIFAATALTESLFITAYKKAGKPQIPDFSEQYLQWSVKTELKKFPNTVGSSGDANLTALNKFGIVEEKVWPYDTLPWNTVNDAVCDTTQKNLPTKCYTNGSPPAAATTATKFKLPAKRYLRSTAQNLKGILVNKKTPIVTGGDFFYQSWNHRKSVLPTNAEYWRNGYVLAPNAADVAEAQKTPAGHEFVLVGYDDTLEVPTVDKDGKQVLNAAGKPVMEKGFFLFKNSWGTTSFGVNNKLGAGYGWISYKYVETYFDSYTTNVPSLPK